MGCSIVALKVATLEGTSDDNCHPQDFCCGWRKHFVASRKSPSKRKFWETALTIDHARVRMPLGITAAKTIKNTYSNASFSSITAAIESLGLSNNGFKTA